MSTTEKTRLTDRDVVVDLLRRKGPRTLRALREDRTLEEWPEARLENAVAHAWADNALSFDVEDRLVAL